MLAELVYISCVFRIGYRVVGNLILLDMGDFDVILGMDWLVVHHVIIHRYSKEVVFHLPG